MSVYTSFADNRSLISKMVRREIAGRYKGSVLGVFWSLINPVIMLAVYTFVFSFVFNARWSIDSGSKTEFALALFIGLMTHSLFSECINKAPTLIVSNINYVKKVVFPLDIFPWVSMGAAIFHFLISFAVWACMFALVTHSFNWTAIFLPIIFFPLILFTVGLTWILSSLGVYLRDISQVTGVITTVMLFLAPVFYPISALPEQYHIYIYANPLTLIIEQSRDVLMWGVLPDFRALAIATLIALAVAFLGYWWFDKTRRGFADVL
ncbi:ABC transporter permease [Oceanicoccus sagamiensis]|uniref:Transport permease protein n=1 Tax=Oceanicoccus sagamiensis TaxID=716816 RepID=A0A1X9N9X9_9GAMM|nr:ABC transporter permease [Oceanicoccus sagamiensis]ARN73884.1 sugar ABC transporter permease [Oceanicoccus sagamiensis]